jgi:hypothetical protein
LNGVGRSGEDFIAVLHHIHNVLRAASVAGDKVGSATVPLLDELEPVEDGCIVGIGAVSLINPHDMAGQVSDVDVELLRVFAVFSGNLEGHFLFLLCDRVACWQNDHKG